MLSQLLVIAAVLFILRFIQVGNLYVGQRKGKDNLAASKLTVCRRHSIKRTD